MKKLMMIAVLMAAAATAQAADPISVMGLVAKGEVSGDVSFTIQILERCSGLYAVFTELLDNENYKNVGVKFIVYSGRLRNAQARKHGREEKGQEKALGAMGEHAIFYAARLKSNQHMTGEMFGQDPYILADLESCQYLAQSVERLVQ